MQLLMQQMVNGIALGSIYAMIALGYTMVYGTIRLINFAHGDVYMLGAFLGYYLVTVLGVNWMLALLITMGVIAVVGVLIERIAYKPLRHSTRVAALITAIGVSYLIQNLMIYFVGPEMRAFPAPIEVKMFKVFGLIVNSKQLLVLAVTITVMIALQIIVQHTRMGKAMRAVAVDQDAAQLMGINVDLSLIHI